MKKYVVKLTEDELTALFIASGCTPYSDNASTLARIFNILDDNTHISNMIRGNRKAINSYTYDDLIECLI